MLFISKIKILDNLNLYVICTATCNVESHFCEGQCLLRANIRANERH